MRARPTRISIRYFVCREGQLTWALSNPVHSQLIKGELHLPAFAGQTVEILEVFISKKDGTFALLNARGTRWHFDQQGKLDIANRSVTAIGDRLLISMDRTKRIVDLQPQIRQRRRRAEDMWQPTETLKDQVLAELTKKRSKLSAFPN